MSTSTEYMDGLNASVERRFYPRVTPPTPIYVAFGSNNLGILHNVSENGLQVKTPGGLPLNSVFRVFLSLNGAPKTITVSVRTVWTDDTEKRSGIQLLDLADEDRAQIRRWVEFEISRGESSTPWRVPENGDRRVPKIDPDDRSAVAGGENLNARVAPPAASAPLSSPETSYDRPLSNAEQRSGRRFNGAFVPKDRIASERLPDEVAAVAAAAGDVTESKQDLSQNSGPVSGAAPRRPTAYTPPAPAPAADASSIPPAEVNEADLPKIANPFDHPDPNVEFNSPFAKVPLPIHGEFEYASQPAKVRRRPTMSSRLRAKPLVVWAAVLAVVCFGANALVKYKIKRNSQHYATESAKYSPPKSDAAAPDSTAPVDDSGAGAATPSSADTTSSGNQSTPSSPAYSASGAQTDATSGAVPPAQSVAKRSESPSAQTGTRQQSSVDAREGSAYTATAPPSSDRSQYTARTSQPAATPRTWSAPAPNQSGSIGASANDAPQSPNVTASSDNAAAQSAPIVSQARPTAPPAPAVQAPSGSNTSSSGTATTSNSSAANNAPARTQQQAPVPQTQTYAANSTPANTSAAGNASTAGNATAARPQSPIYNANTPQQRSAVMGSINSVHSSGIFDSNDTTSGNAAPSAASRGNSANPNANANVSTRGVVSSPVVPTDTPQERDLEIVAPKGFKDSYVDIPGEHVVRSATATIRMHRFVHVPGERVPGQRWLWRGKLNVTLGEVINRIDPSVVQASGASGSLTVQATIDKDGYVTDLKPINGNFAMLPAVSRAVRNWHYEPTYLDSKRAETLAQIEFDLRPTAASSRTAQR
jgi:PilZ domain/Gram-negative bacterial TonB protein C-terminal